MNAVLLPERRDLLRQAALAQRNSLSRSETSLRSQQIQDRAMALVCYRDAKAVALYSPIRNEVDTGALLADALASGKKVFLPRWLGQEFGFAQIASCAELVAGRYAILEPTGSNGLSAADRLNLVVFVPGVVFDGRGHRLGRGFGGYDRLLRDFNDGELAVGLSYEFQVVDAVPAESWDRTMQFIVTENRTIDCNPGSMGY